MRLFDYDAFTLLDADRAYCSAPQFDTDAALPFYPIKNRRSLRSRIRTRSSNRSELPSRIWQLTATTWTGSQAWENRDQPQDG